MSFQPAMLVDPGVVTKAGNGGWTIDVWSIVSWPSEQRFFLKWKEYEERGTGKRARKRNNWKFSWLRKRRKHFRVSVDDKSLRKQLA